MRIQPQRCLCLLLIVPISSAWSLPKSSTTKGFLSSQPQSRPFNQLTRLSLSRLAMNADTAAVSMTNEPPSANKCNWSIVALLVSAFLNLLGFTMAGPITPALGQHFDLTVGASFGSLTSAYPLGMLFGLFLWPSLSDKLGRPPVMTLSLLGTGLGLAAQAYVVATNKPLWIFLLSRVITGSFAGSSPIAKAYLADISGPNLSRNLAWRDAASTLAFLVGPLLGGVFLGSTTSLTFVIGLSSVASLLAAVIVGALVQETDVVGGVSSKKENTVADEGSKMKQFDNTAADIISCPLGTSIWSGVATVCVISFLFNVGDSTFHAFFSALLKAKNVSASSIGLVYSSLAAISFGVSAGGTAKIMKKFGPVPTCAMGLLCVGSGLVSMGLGASSAAWVTVAAASIYYCGVPLYSPTIPTILLRCVPPNKRGFILGLDGAINTIARIFTPLVMGQLYKTRGASAAFGLAGKAALLAATVAVAKRVHVVRQEQRQVVETKVD